MEKKEEEKILAEAKKRFSILDSANSHLRESFVKNMRFSFNIGDGHWDDEDVVERDKQGRPHLTANKLGKFVARVVNAERGMPDRELVIPVDGQADPKTASLYNNIIEDIEYHSDYDQIIATEGEYAVGGGYGFWRIVTEIPEGQFDQVIRIKPIVNPLMVSLEKNKRYGFIREGLAMDEFEEKYPGKERPSDFKQQEDDELWYEEEKIYIAEYFRRIPVKKVIAEVMTPKGKIVVEVKEGEQLENIVRQKEINSYKIEWYKLTGHCVLDQGEWAGDSIPIIEICGHKLSLEGQTYKKSLTDDAQDMQKAYNYWLTSLTEKVALTPKAPYIVTEQQIRGHEDEWEDANVKNRPFLTVNNTSQGFPQRTPAPEVGQGELLMLNICEANIKDTLGQYDASVGKQSNERSGKAIQARAANSDMVTFHFPDNLRRAKEETKKMLIKLIPKIYDNERVMRLIGRAEPVELNTMAMDSELGPIVKNDLSVGQYDIRANVPANPSIRQQAADNLREAMQYGGEAYAGIILPEFFKTLDVPGMDELSDKIEQKTKAMEQQQQMKAQADSGMLPDFGGMGG